jgi:hypothetical protein
MTESQNHTKSLPQLILHAMEIVLLIDTRQHLLLFSIQHVLYTGVTSKYLGKGTQCRPSHDRVNESHSGPFRVWLWLSTSLHDLRLCFMSMTTAKDGTFFM